MRAWLRAIAIKLGLIKKPKLDPGLGKRLAEAIEKGEYDVKKIDWK